MTTIKSSVLAEFQPNRLSNKQLLVSRFPYDISGKKLHKHQECKNVGLRDDVVRRVSAGNLFGITQTEGGTRIKILLPVGEDNFRMARFSDFTSAATDFRPNHPSYGILTINPS